jgi:hypothetical protein
MILRAVEERSSLTTQSLHCVLSNGRTSILFSFGVPPLGGSGQIGAFAAYVS